MLQLRANFGGPMARGSPLLLLRQSAGPAASAAAARLSSVLGSAATAMMASPGGPTLPLAFLLMSSVLPIVKVLLIAAMGLISALPFFDVLNKESRHSLSKVRPCRPPPLGVDPPGELVPEICSARHEAGLWSLRSAVLDMRQACGVGRELSSQGLDIWPCLGDQRKQRRKRW